MVAKLYVEGAGQTDLERSQCRKAFASFFKAAKIANRPRTIACGGRQHAYDAFKTAISQQSGQEVPLLLVDSEAPIQAGHTVWQHLKQRDGWDKPANAADSQAFLMVQVMETWLLSDGEMLAKYFGQHFKNSTLKLWPSLEAVSKSTVLDALDVATRTCSKQYKKGRVSFELLETLHPETVEGRCPHAKDFLDRLRAL